MRFFLLLVQLMGCDDVQGEEAYPPEDTDTDAPGEACEELTGIYTAAQEIVCDEYPGCWICSKDYEDTTGLTESLCEYYLEYLGDDPVPSVVVELEAYCH